MENIRGNKCRATIINGYCHYKINFLFYKPPDRLSNPKSSALNTHKYVQHWIDSAYHMYMYEYYYVIIIIIAEQGINIAEIRE